jgi:hypothetical protein
MQDLLNRRHWPLVSCLGDPGLLVRQCEVLGVRRGQVRSVSRLCAEPLKEATQSIENGKDCSSAKSLPRPLADLLRELTFEPNGLLNMKQNDSHGILIQRMLSDLGIEPRRPSEDE